MLPVLVLIHQNLFQPTVGNQLQLVQGPDGQFVLQSTGPIQQSQISQNLQQTILTQNVSQFCKLSPNFSQPFLYPFQVENGTGNPSKPFCYGGNP